jgi:hypothetical protein
MLRRDYRVRSGSIVDSCRWVHVGYSGLVHQYALSGSEIIPKPPLGDRSVVVDFQDVGQWW